MNTYLEELLALAGFPADASSFIRIDGADPVLPTPYRVADAAAACCAAIGLAAARAWQLKRGEMQQVHVNARHAAVSLRSTNYCRVAGEKLPASANLTGFYKTRDDRWLYLHCGFSGVEQKNLRAVGVAGDRAALAAGVLKRDAQDLEDAVFDAGGCGAIVRSYEEWQKVPQYAFVSKAPLIEITRIGDAPPMPFPGGETPLSGLRVLDLTRVLAGPTSAKLLASHGADVLKITSPHLDKAGVFDVDTSLGKLSAYLDLNQAADAQALRNLVKQADVFSQSYRPSALASRGFGPQELAALRPGLVYASLNAWGNKGPWSHRRGFDTVVSCANGMTWQPNNEMPVIMPVSAQDYLGGQLMALGTLLALLKRAEEGGSWQVNVSLAGAGNWLHRGGLLDASSYAQCAPELPPEELADYVMQSPSPLGVVTHLKPVTQMSATPAVWTRPSIADGTSPPGWP